MNRLNVTVRKRMIGGTRGTFFGFSQSFCLSVLTVLSCINDRRTVRTFLCSSQSFQSSAYDDRRNSENVLWFHRVSWTPLTRDRIRSVIDVCPHRREPARSRRYSQNVSRDKQVNQSFFISLSFIHSFTFTRVFHCLQQ